ncbi:hypothetical protein F5Y17DRAFT_477095 [Xylariaceae sp. FL0594]|nr:hypothetical protein F5Y17DRAFT_477095 [Xylariaceae sp. FL0594]
MAPKYELYADFTAQDALAAAGSPQEGVFHKGEPPVWFFTDAPENSPAIFSTVSGTRPFRMVENPTFERPGSYMHAAEIQLICDEFRRNMPEECRSVEPMQDYFGLYQYFDAYDIYVRGAQNLWNVVHHLVWENRFVQDIVDKEQMELEADDKKPLLDDLSIQLLKDTSMQNKLMGWKRDQEPDVLAVFTPSDLQIFEGYESYHEYLLQVLRSIFERHYACMLNDLPLVHHIPPTVDARKDTLRAQYNDPMFDPFMDKFDVADRIVSTRPLVVDGTSATAARRAGYTGALSRANTATKRENVSIPPTISEQAGLSATDESTTERFSSAPTFGGDPKVILDSPGSGSDKEPRIYPGNSHVVGPKLMGCIKPDDPPTMHHASQMPGTVSAPVENTLQRIPSVMEGREVRLPRVRDHTSAGRRFGGRDSSVSQTHMPPTSNASTPSLAFSSGVEGDHNPGAPQMNFPYQGGSCALPQHQNQPLPMMQKQAQAASGFYGGMNSNAKQPPTNTAGPYQSAGIWQQVGSDEIHGPKVVFRRDTTGSRFGTHQQGIRQQSMAGDRRPNNTMGQGGTGPGNHNNTWNAGSRIEPGNRTFCVNVGKEANVYTKFDPCNCFRCSNLNRSIFIRNLDLRQAGSDDKIKMLLIRHFSQYGHVESVDVRPFNRLAYLKFATDKSPVSAVNAGSRVSIDGLGDNVGVHFRTGSHYYTPRQKKSPNYYPGTLSAATPGGGQMTMRHPFVDGSSDLNPMPIPFQHGISAVGPTRALDSTGQSIMAPQSNANTPMSSFSTMHGNAPGFASMNGNMDRIGGEQYQRGRRPFSSTMPQAPPQNYSNHASTMPRNFVPPQGQSIYRDFTQSAVPTGYPPPPIPFPPRVVQGSPTPAPRGLTPKREGDGSGTMDYGTVRVRPGKAKYVPIPSDWRQESTSLQPVEGCATIQRPLESQAPPVDAESSHVSRTNSSEQVHTEVHGSKENLDKEALKAVAAPSQAATPEEGQENGNLRAKRKADETEKDLDTFGKTWPKKKLAQGVQSGISEEGLSAESRQVDEQASLNVEKKKTSNANQTKTQQKLTEGGPPEAQNFEPTINTSELPAYPQNAAEQTQGQNASDSTPSSSGNAGKPGTTPSSGKSLSCEPFPVYRDVMSGDHVGPEQVGDVKKSPNLSADHNQKVVSSSASSSSSTTLKMPSPEKKNKTKKSISSKGLNPGAQDFVPSSSSSAASNSLSSAALPLRRQQALRNITGSSSPPPPPTTTTQAQFQTGPEPFDYQLPPDLQNNNNNNNNNNNRAGGVVGPAVVTINNMTVTGGSSSSSYYRQPPLHLYGSSNAGSWRQAGTPTTATTQTQAQQMGMMPQLQQYQGGGNINTVRVGNTRVGNHGVPHIMPVMAEYPLPLLNNSSNNRAASNDQEVTGQQHQEQMMTKKQKYNNKNNNSKKPAHKRKNEDGGDRSASGSSQGQGQGQCMPTGSSSSAATGIESTFAYTSRARGMKGYSNNNNTNKKNGNGNGNERTFTSTKMSQSQSQSSDTIPTPTAGPTSGASTLNARRGKKFLNSNSNNNKRSFTTTHNNTRHQRNNSSTKEEEEEDSETKKKKPVLDETNFPALPAPAPAGPEKTKARPA